jgi:uncharacterized protein (DUF433 family)
MNPLLQRISVDPNICFGKPCIRGTRIWVSLILDFLAAGMTVEEIIEEYPHLTTQDVLAAIAYGAEMSRERYVEIPIGHSCPQEPKPAVAGIFNSPVFANPQYHVREQTVVDCRNRPVQSAPIRGRRRNRFVIDKSLCKTQNPAKKATLVKKHSRLWNSF